jgi:serine/threonine protein kinase
VASVVPFDKYLLLGRIAQGGMAEVFLAKTFGAAGFEKFVAIKRLLPSVMHNEEFVGMFIDEAKIASQLNHANITQIYELGEQEGQFFIAMEFVHGKELRAINVRAKKLGRRLDPRFSAHIIAKAAEGLDYAHHRKDTTGKPMSIIHRDISPQNILLSYDGETKVIDFGIAKAKDRMSQTQVGVLKGKIGYMSPEQVSGVSIDERSDLFSLGCVLYELLTQERAFKGESEFATFEKVRNAEYTPPETYGVKLDAELDRIARKVLAKDRDQRYSRGSELATDLQRYLLQSGNPLTNDDVADHIRGVFETEYKAEMEKLSQYRQTKAPAELQELLSNKQRRKAAEKELEDHTMMISLNKAAGDEPEDTVTDRVAIDDDMVVSEEQTNRTVIQPMGALGLSGGGMQQQQGGALAPATKAPPPPPPAETKPKITESQEIENEIRAAFKDMAPAQVVPLTKKKGNTDPRIVTQAAKKPNSDQWGMGQLPRGPMIETIDDVNSDAASFTRGEIILIVIAIAIAMAFVAGVYIYTSKSGAP